MPEARARWRPILEAAAAERAWAAIERIAAALYEAPATVYHQVLSASLAGGEAGLALFFAYLERARPGEGYGAQCERRLDSAVDQIAAMGSLADLYLGFTGVAWVVEHLEGGAGQEDANEEIDRALRDHLAQSPWTREIDLTSGLAGYGLYALDRLPRPLAAECLELAITRLAETAERQPDGAAWLTPPERMSDASRALFPRGHYNLGVAHGLPGIVPILAQACAAGVAEATARPLLEGAVSWLLARRLGADQSSIFPYCLDPDGEAAPSRAAWCYGDPGIAAALLVAARAIGREAWEREAVATARTAARRPPETCGVRDGGLCHGAAGLGHLFNRLYQATGDPTLLAAARQWFERTLDLAEPGRGYGGFLTWGMGADGEMTWMDDASFLGGAAGIGLALLAAAAPVEPAWDRVLLASPAGRGGERGSAC